MSVIATIETAVLSALRAGEAHLPFRWGTLESYPEDWDKWFRDKGGRVRAPGGWVVLAGWSRDEAGGSSTRYRLQFGLVLMSENARDEQSTRHGDPADPRKPGVYLLAEWAARLLDGQNLGLDIDAIEVGALRHVRPPEALAGRKVAMMSLAFETVAELGGYPPAGGDVGDFATFHANWDIPVFGGVDGAPAPGIQLPADGEADASDHVTLPVQP